MIWGTGGFLGRTTCITRAVEGIGCLQAALSK
jgi:hypothetical protein